MKPRCPKEYLIVIFVVVATATAIYLAKPLPPPNVSIEFQGFKPGKAKIFHLMPETNYDNQVFFESITQDDWWFRAFPGFRNFSTDQTNAYCTLYLTNRGPTRIWWISMDCQVEARTPNGWVTNVFSHFTTSPWSVGPSSKDNFTVYVPMDAIEWRVTGYYEYYKRHNVGLEFFGWLFDDLKLGRAGKPPPKIIVYPLIGIVRVFALLPEPKEESCVVHSEFFTNHPPRILSAALPKP